MSLWVLPLLARTTPGEEVSLRPVREGEIQYCSMKSVKFSVITYGFRWLISIRDGSNQFRSRWVRFLVRKQWISEKAEKFSRSCGARLCVSLSPAKFFFAGLALVSGILWNIWRITSLVKSCESTKIVYSWYFASEKYGFPIASFGRDSSSGRFFLCILKSVLGTTAVVAVAVAAVPFGESVYTQWLRCGCVCYVCIHTQKLPATNSRRESVRGLENP